MISWLDHWQTLVAGLVGSLIALAAGVIAYIGALRAAKRQVAAIREQIAEERAARRQADERKLSVVEWAVRAEGRRLEAAVAALRRALPGRQQYAARRWEQLVIASSPLLRGEREDMSSLDHVTLTLLEAIASVIDDYNSRIQTAVDPSGGAPLIEQATLHMFDRLAELVRKLIASVPK